MLEAVAISIAVAIVLGLIAISVLKILDRREQDNITAKNDIAEIGAEHVVGDKTDASGLKVGEPTSDGVTKKLNKRVSGIGVVAAGIFAVLAARIGSMQLFNQSSYEKAANDNQFTSAKTPAGRGIIYDKHNRELVYSKSVSAVVCEKDVVDNTDTLKKMSAVLGLPYGIVRSRANDSTNGASARRVIVQEARERDVAYILEHKDAFPGVFVETRSIRTYPFGALAAHVLGYTGYPTEEQLNQNSKLSSDDTIGKAGVETQYNDVLSGEAGTREVRVDANGNIIEIRDEIDPVQGSNVVLTIDAHAQYVADAALAKALSDRTATSGAVVCIDVRDGSIVAMASAPTFDPNNFTGGVPQDTWNLYSQESSYSPMLNRSISSEYAPGSTMKAFSTMAGLKYGFATQNSSYYCTGSWDGWNSGTVQDCWKTAGHGTISLHTGIVESCDVVFYEIAKNFYDNSNSDNPKVTDTSLQEYYEMFEFGSKLGIDLPDETAGLVPTPAWKAERWRNVPSEAIWSGGDLTNMIIGQGNLLATPLQLACAYCGIATGKIMKPHVLSEVKNSNGDVVLSEDAEVITEPDMNASDIAFVREALHDMATTDATVGKLVSNAGIDIAGKTGTAEHSGKRPDAIFVGYGPYTDPKFVCACVLQAGDSGGEYAAPIVVDVLKAAIDGEENGELEVGTVAGYAGESLLDPNESSSVWRND